MQTPPPKRTRPKRKRQANAAHDEATAAFAVIGGVLTVTNDGEHWAIRFTGRSIVRVDWWSSTGRVMVDCRPGRTERRKTWQRLLAYVKERLAGKRYSSCKK